MNDWRELKLGDVCKVKGGKRLPKGKTLSDVPNLHPYIRIRDVGKTKSLTLTTDFEYVDDETQRQIKNYIVSENDVIISIVGTIGLVAKISRSLDKANLTENCAKLIELQDANSDFLYYYLTSDAGQCEIKKGTVGAVQPKLPLKNIQDININLPPLPEQRAIAATLSCLDDKIELNRKINKNLEELAQAIFKRWFVDFEFPDENGQPYKSSGGAMVDSELGMIPAGWRVGKFGDISAQKRQLTDPISISANTAYIGLEHMPRGAIALHDWANAEDLSSVKYQFEQGDILFGKLRPYFHKVGVAPINGVCSTDIVVIKPQSNEWYSYVLCIASSQSFVDYATAGSTGTKMPRTNWNDMAAYKICVPVIEKASALDLLIQPCIIRIISNLLENRILSLTRDTLLPKLMSGEIRVPIEMP
ncbi:MAG: restriction endonuclease subunit S [Bacillota bacterium]